MDKFVYNHCKPGIGKTKKIHQVLEYCVEEGLKVMICMPNHSLITEVTDYNEYNHVHLWGKDHYCPKEGLEQYNPDVENVIENVCIEFKKSGQEKGQ
ncbi:MAG: hypothetical protein BAJALOKI2v1_90059 [Promethearchaeota archaeon]|nr:MAG: hypothetical protein BAJALOKI2v1_90059 [Candidatus Lokiarchaeota archaeon]